MREKGTVIACVNQKGGVGKTCTAEHLAAGLTRAEKRVLLIDLDPQASLTISLGYHRPDELECTITDHMKQVIANRPADPIEGILHHKEGMDLMPANIELAALEVSLVNTISRETVLKEYIAAIRERYEYIILDCSPSLGMLTVNAMAAADKLIIPVQASYLSAKGLEQLLRTVNQVKRQINPKVRIEGILLTMVDSRTNDAREIATLIRNTYGSRLKVYDAEIPRSIRASEISKEGCSLFLYDPEGKVAKAYDALTREVLAIAEKQRKHSLEQLR